MDDHSNSLSVLGMCKEAERPGMGNSLLFPCRFPGGLRIAGVHAGFTMGIFLAGKHSLLNSLTREFAILGTGSAVP